MADFEITEDIANQALQLCGAQRIVSLSDNSKNAAEIAFVYDKARRAELRRNVWVFATRKAVLRPISNTTMALVPAAWDATKSYVIGSLVSYQSKTYYALTNANLNQAPNLHNGWTLYFGPMIVSLWDTATAYFSGELVYTPATTSYGVYLSLQNSNSDDPTATPAWDATVTYSVGQTVTYSAVVYESTRDLNLNHAPGGAEWQVIPGTQPDVMHGQKWLKLDATLLSITIVYPIGTGPIQQSTTKNVYQLPNGYLRKAPQDPKAGSSSYLGAETGARYDDWLFEGNYLISRDNTPIIFRFCADIDDVPLMDPMFCEGLAARLALMVCETLTQSTSKIQNIGAMYKQFIGDARAVNGIEAGSEETSVDDYISCRW